MDPLQLPVAPAVIPQIVEAGPSLHDPVTDEDIANAQIHYARVVRRRLDFDPAVTNEHIVSATRFAKQIDRVVNPMDEAPLWFQVYAAQALLRHNELRNESLLLHNELHNELVNGLALTYNRTSRRSQDAIKPLLDVNGIVPPNFPATRGALFQLNSEQCTLLLIAYNLNAGGSVLVKRERLAVHIGLIL